MKILILSWIVLFLPLHVCSQNIEELSRPENSPIKIELAGLYKKCEREQQFFIEVSPTFKGEPLDSIYLVAKKSSPEYFIYELSTKNNLTAVCISEFQAAFGQVIANYGFSRCTGIKYKVSSDLRHEGARNRINE